MMKEALSPPKEDVPQRIVQEDFNSLNRAALLLKFLELTEEDKFEQYPRLAKAFQKVLKEFAKLGIDEDLVMVQMSEILHQLEDEVFNLELKSGRANSLPEELRDRILDRIHQILPPDSKLHPLEKAFKKFYLRALEVLAVFDKQQREGIASHRAHSEKKNGEYAFGGPELSLQAIIEALKQGIRNIELDIQATSEGTPVISHSAYTRTDQGKERIDGHTWGALRSLNPTIDRTGAPMYTLNNLLQEFKNYQGLARLNIEVKNSRATSGVINLIKKHQLEDSVMVSSFDPYVILEVHQHLPQVMLGFNTIITELNAKNILEKPKRKKNPLEISTGALTLNHFKGRVAIGGSELPEDNHRQIILTVFKHLPAEIIAALQESAGYLSVQVPAAKYLKWRGPLRALKQKAKKLGIKLLIYRVSPKKVKNLHQDIDLIHLDKGSNLTFSRMQKHDE